MTEEDKGGSTYRQFPPLVEKIITVYTVILIGYHIAYVINFFDYFNVFIEPAINMALHLSFLLPLVFIWIPPTKKRFYCAVPWFDYLLIGLALTWNLYMVINFGGLYQRSLSGVLNSFEYLMVWVNIIIVLEAARRAGGWPIPATALAFIAYVFVGEYLPGFLTLPHYDITRVGRYIGLFVTGLYGSILDISATLVIMFLFFGQVLQSSGAGNWFINMSNAILGHVRGGPAKVAVVASSLFGMVSGSGIANTASIGVITIPLMKRIGYKPHFAAGVEAAASNGGQIMPPVMGIAAFLMADFLGISYAKVALIGILPALLYYLALFIMVDMEAVKTGLKGLPKEDIPDLKKTFMEGWQYILPLTALVFLLIVLLYSPEKSALYATATLLVVSFFKKKGRMGPRRIIEACRSTAQSMLLVVTMCAGAGVVIGSVSMSGLGYRLSTGLVDLAGGNLFFLAILSAIACLILGLNLPTSVCYLIGAILIAPGFAQIGISPIVAHFFVFFYAVAALITPPVCETAFVAAGIAGAPPMRTGFTACRLASTSLIIPFFFLVNPALLLQGTSLELILTTILAILGIIFSSCGFSGFFLEKANWLEMILFIAGGLLLIYPTWYFIFTGMVLISVGTILQIIKRRGQKAIETGPIRLEEGS